MATVYVSADRIRARANRLDPVKVFITLIALPFIVVCYVARFVWLALSLVIAAGLEGWDLADKQINAARADTRGG